MRERALRASMCAADMPQYAAQALRAIASQRREPRCCRGAASARRCVADAMLRRTATRCHPAMQSVHALLQRSAVPMMPCRICCQRHYAAIRRLITRDAAPLRQLLTPHGAASGDADAAIRRVLPPFTLFFAATRYA